MSKALLLTVFLVTTLCFAVPAQANHSDATHIVAKGSKTSPWVWDRSAFGDKAPGENSSGAGTFTYDLRVPSRYTDFDSAGLNHNHVRDYTPALTRYVEADPLGFPGGLNGQSGQRASQ
jgi:RHS repeat-associated protein